MRGELTSPFLDSLPFFGAIELCEVLGGIDLCGTPVFRRNIATPERLRDARERGFAILSSGIESFSAYVHRIFMNVWTGYRPVSRDIYGSLYTWLAGKDGDIDFAPVRDVVEAHAKANLPLGPGDPFFFQTKKRNRHSVQTLAKKYSIHYTRIEKMLIAGGFTTAADLKQTQARVLFEAKHAESFVQGYDGTCSVYQGAERLGLALTVFSRLSGAGYFAIRKVRYADGSTKLRCSEEELDALLRRANHRAVPCDSPEGRWFNLHKAASECRCSWEEIFQFLIDGVLENLVYTERPTLQYLRVSLDEVRQKLHLKAIGFAVQKSVQAAE